MLNSDRSEQFLEGEVLHDGAPGGLDLVPLAASVRWSAKAARSRPDAGFVAQLIATAELAPQTRGLRRASPADAQLAYGPQSRPRIGIRTRQIV